MMNLKSFEFLFKSEESVKQYLIYSCWKNHPPFCIRCRTRKIYHIRRDRYRCSHCGYEFSDFTGRWINKVKLPTKDWLWLIKLFELEISARKASQQLGISYPTVLKAFQLIRQAITAHTRNGDHLLNGKIEANETYFGGGNKDCRFKGISEKIPVFGILERKGKVRVEVLKDLNAETLLNLTVKTVRRGSIIYTDKLRSYDALMFCGYKHLRVEHRKRFTRSDVYINGLDGFWSYAKERMNRFHGVSKEKFPFYLKEMEFRYNHRHKPIFEMLVQYLCDFTGA
jgi:transposase